MMSPSVSGRISPRKNQMNGKVDQGLFEEKKLVRRREYYGRVTEAYIWVIISSLVMIGPVLDLLSGAGLVRVIAQRSADIVLFAAVLMFPLVFKLIFNVLPVEFIRRRQALRSIDGDPALSDNESNMKKAEASVLSGAHSSVDLSQLSASELFSLYATSSRNLSQGLFNRSGVYLLVGVIVAFSGLAFFYLETLRPISSQGVDLVIALAPKFGILFFIELVAFFFLRQYRSAMDEFRYYEAVKRKREETLALISISRDGDKQIDILEMVKSGFFFSDTKTLNKDQSTEIIESRKLEKNELEVLEKVIDVVSRSKK